jgi:8-oxo-dGTP diphosphatase
VTLYEVCVVYLLRESADGTTDVLLGYKRTGLGLGKVVGIGGKIEPGEGTRDAAVREMHEETGLVLDPADLTPVGVLDYLFPTRPEWSQRSYVFTCRRWAGEAVETEEIVPAWFSIDAVPFTRMWDDAARWLPRVLRGGSVDAEYTFGDDLATVVAEGPRTGAGR